MTDLVGSAICEEVHGFSVGVGQRHAQCGQRVGRALAVERLHPLPGALQVAFSDLRESSLPALGLAVERDQVELLLVSKLFLHACIHVHVHRYSYSQFEHGSCLHSIVCSITITSTHLHEAEQFVLDKLDAGLHRRRRIDQNVDLRLDHRSEQLTTSLLQPIDSKKYNTKINTSLTNMTLRRSGMSESVLKNMKKFNRRTQKDLAGVNCRRIRNAILGVDTHLI